jgi:CHAT domain-containing protein
VKSRRRLDELKTRARPQPGGKQEDRRRQQAERRHAQDIARLSRPAVIEVRQVPRPKPEPLRVLYLTANPEQNLRVDVEVRQVQQAVKAALHRDQIEIVPRVAATPEDLLEGLNDVRPHVVHFSGHSGHATLVFDNASVETPEGRDLTFDLLARALAATSTPPVLVVLNGCDTLEGAEVLLDATPVVIGMESEITDLAAAAFAARFYGAIAAAQPVQAALEQGAVAVDFLGLSEGWKPNCLVRDGVSLDALVLVKVARV